jgi:hypothetical protein
MMKSKDTGKVRLNSTDAGYLHAEIYADGDITEDDIPPVIGFLDQYKEPVPALIERQGHYSISIVVQIAMMQQTHDRLKAVAFVERNHRDVILSRIAASTYFRDIPVKSFFEREPAIAWLMQFCNPTSLEPKRQNTQ